MAAAPDSEGRGGMERSIGLAQVLRMAGVGDDAPPRLGRFDVLRKLGRGGMGTVYEASDPELERLVAIKILHRRGLAGQGSGSGPASDIRQEARALAKLTHPNVVSVYDVGEEGDQVFVAMEHMPGGTLAERLEHDPPGTWTELLRYFIDAGRGLAAAHAAGIVHRDFKAENILIDANGTAKVADFGLASFRDGGEGAAADPGYVVGTRALMAPEVLAGQPADPASDQYSYCAAMAEGLRSHGSEVPANVWSLLSRGMRDEAAQRWPSVAALVDALARRVDGPRDRHRDALIDRVRRIWVDGVLDASLDGRPLVSLPLSRIPELVDSPWEHAPAPAPRDDGVRLRTSHLPELFDESNGALLIVGAPGSGKTTTALGLARSLLDRAERDSWAPVPAVLNLASYRPHRSLSSWVEKELVTKYRLPRQRVARWLDSDELVLVLDGLDELSSARREPCIQAINAFRSEHAVPLVVACREDEYRANPTRLGFGAAVRLDPLEPEDVARWGADAANGPLDEPLRTPLWLTLAAGRTDPSPRAPGAGSPSWPAVFARYVEDALDRGPAVPEAEREQWWRRLRWLAGNMARRDDADLWLDSMQHTWLPGRTRQLLAMALGTLVLTAAYLLPAAAAMGAVGFPARAGLIIGLGGLVVSLAFNRGLTVRTGERVRWSLGKGLRRTPAMMALTGATAAIYAPVANRPFGATVFAALAGGAVVGLMLGLHHADRSRGIHPYDGLRTALRQSALIAAACAGGTGLLYALVITPATAALFPEWLAASQGMSLRTIHSVPLGTIFGLILGGLYGGIAVTLHATHRLVLATTTPLPLRLVTWLDDATRRGLLRRVGGGYMFMHATLLRTLAAGLPRPPR